MRGISNIIIMLMIIVVILNFVFSFSLFSAIPFLFGAFLIVQTLIGKKENTVSNQQSVFYYILAFIFLLLTIWFIWIDFLYK
ncbi:uncharacterized protein YqhQ [Geomicrobium sediminis]|uniref:Uncharacterized protein YqhQ n=1 Tax=Geomicrobium sediminis TaxID=1347788 RepID=A0ABS2P7L2_9BACL|nr:uncharacterized protein YqhQ [Geomicrobium sediminis]